MKLAGPVASVRRTIEANRAHQECGREKAPPDRSHLAGERVTRGPFVHRFEALAPNSLETLAPVARKGSARSVN